MRAVRFDADARRSFQLCAESPQSSWPSTVWRTHRSPHSGCDTAPANRRGAVLLAHHVDYYIAWRAAAGRFGAHLDIDFVHQKIRDDDNCTCGPALQQQLVHRCAEAGLPPAHYHRRHERFEIEVELRAADETASLRASSTRDASRTRRFAPHRCRPCRCTRARRLSPARVQLVVALRQSHRSARVD